MNSYKWIMALAASLVSGISLADVEPVGYYEPGAGQTFTNTTVAKQDFKPIDNKTVVKPGRMEVVNISQTDVNLIVCKAGAITDRTYSQEKPLIYKAGEGTEGSVGYVKLQQQQIDGEARYYTKEVELYLTCGGEIYSLMLIPKDIRSQHITLSPGERGDIERNLALFSELDLETSAVTLIDKTQYEVNLPASFSISTPGADETRWKEILPDVRARLVRSVKPDGIGLIVHEYLIYSWRDQITLNEFDVVGLHKNTFAVRLTKQVLRKRETAKAYIVERMWR